MELNQVIRFIYFLGSSGLLSGLNSNSKDFDESLVLNKLDSSKSEKSNNDSVPQSHHTPEFNRFFPN